MKLRFMISENLFTSWILKEIKLSFGNLNNIGLFLNRSDLGGLSEAA